MLQSASTLEEAFPEIDPGFTPFGEKVLIQIRSVVKKTKGGIFIPDSTRDFNKQETAIGKVIATGPIAYRNRSTGELWTEGVWAKPGDIVRAPRYGGDRWSLPHPTEENERIYFLVCKDIEISGRIDSGRLEAMDELL